MHVEPVGVDEVIQGAMSTIQPSLNGGNVQIIREIASDIAGVEHRSRKRKSRIASRQSLSRMRKFLPQTEARLDCGIITKRVI